MALKPTIVHGVRPTDVIRKISTEFRGVVDLKRLNEATYTVVSFSGMPGESTSIIDSKGLSKALTKLREGSEPVIAVAHNFTREARDMLEKRNAVFFFKSDFFWTDESWGHIRDKR